MSKAAIPVPDVTANYFRYRLRQPADFMRTSFRTKQLTKGIMATVARPRGSQSMVLQSILIDRRVFKRSQADSWMLKHIAQICKSPAYMPCNFRGKVLIRRK